MLNPHKAKITDEASGIEVRNQRYEDWQNGYLNGSIDVLESLTKGVLNVLKANINSKGEMLSL